MKKMLAVFHSFAFLSFALVTAGLRAQEGQSPSIAPWPVTFEVKTASLGKVPSGFREDSLVVSRDGQHLACAVGEFASEDLHREGVGLPLVMMAERKQKVRIVVDGVESPGKDAVGVPVFSPDGRRTAHAERAGFWGVTVDGAASAPCKGIGGCDEVGTPVFSLDSRHVAYRAGRWKIGSLRPKWRMVLDGSEGDGYDQMTDPVFGPGGAGPAYLARNGKKDMAVIGDRQTPLAPADGAAFPALSPDGTRFAYIALRNRRFAVVVDGREGRAFDWIGALVFSPAGPLAYPAREGDHALMSVEGDRREALAAYRDVGDPVFSPDGRRMAYWAWDGSAVRIVVDGVEGKPYDEVGQLSFGPDGQHLAAEVRVGSKWSLLVDGAEGPEYVPTKSLGGTATVFAPKEPGDWRQRHRNGWRFARPDLLVYICVRDGEFIRQEVQVRTAARP